MSSLARSEQAMTLIELLIAVALSLLVSLTALAFLQFTSTDVSRITESTHANQTGRLAMEHLILELNSACVAPEIAPVLEGSSGTRLRFISGGGVQASLSHVEAHEVLYTPASGSSPSTLVERSWPATPVGDSDPQSYSFEEAATPSTDVLLSGVRESEVEGGGSGRIPIFRYYRFYRGSDRSPVLGSLDPEALAIPLGAEARDVVKVSVAFTVAPEGRIVGLTHDDRPVPLEDSAILRLVPSSEASTTPNLPCSSTT